MSEPRGATDSRGARAAATRLNLRGSMWNVHHALASMPRPHADTLEGRVQLLEEEAAVRDVLARYTYFYDGADLDGVMSVFHDDCVLINPRGTYAGKDAIRRNYAFLISLSKVVLHLAPNAIVRVLSDSDAWMASYYYGLAVAPDRTLNGTGGTYIDHLVKVAAEWKIIERRISYNFRHKLEPEPFVGSPPEPTRGESSRDIIGPDLEM
jgi:hypothetical protein